MTVRRMSVLIDRLLRDPDSSLVAAIREEQAEAEESEEKAREDARMQRQIERLRRLQERELQEASQ